MPRLGKLEYRHDPRTLRMAMALAPAPSVKIPLTFNTDKGRKAFPVSAFGNDQWGNCVIVGRTNHTLRLERIETRNTPNIATPDVIAEYKAECKRQFGRAPQFAGDPDDNGLFVLEAIKDWRNEGWEILPTARSTKKRKNSIAAYGEIDPKDRAEIRAAIYLLRGVQMGLWLPESAAHQWSRNEPWDSVPTDSPEARPGSWGGHLVYCKSYDEGGVTCITWGREVYMTNAFIERYCDECWAVVDDLSGKVSRYLDVAAMKKHLIDVGATISG